MGGMKRKYKLFEKLYRKQIKPARDNFIEYDLAYPKHEFLKFLVEEKGLLLHGSNNRVIGTLIPIKANCGEKKFGNLKGVYAVTDPILPIFYAIQDNGKVWGTTISGRFSSADKNGDLSMSYHFEIEGDRLRQKPWSPGVVYLLAKKAFRQGRNDRGYLIGEWVSLKPVRPLAKLLVTPADFPYLDQVQSLEPETDPSVDHKKWENELKKKVRACYKIPFAEIHPWGHSLQVVRNVKKIAGAVCPSHLVAAVTGAYLHDIARENDGSGTEHAIKGAAIAAKYFPKSLTPSEKKSLTFAIYHHADLIAPNGGFPVTANFPEIRKKGLIEKLIAALWDADRLEMRRLGGVDKRYLSTKFAKQLLHK